MKEILLTSSVLILSLLLLRRLFRKAISRRVQYALWGLVALRLLVPVSLPAMEHNVLTAAEPVTERITAPALYTTPYRETIVYAPQGALQTPGPYQPFRIDSASAPTIALPLIGQHIAFPVCCGESAKRDHRNADDQRHGKLTVLHVFQRQEEGERNTQPTEQIAEQSHRLDGM